MNSDFDNIDVSSFMNDDVHYSYARALRLYMHNAYTRHKTQYDIIRIRINSRYVRVQLRNVDTNTIKRLYTMRSRICDVHNEIDTHIRFHCD